MTSTPLLPSRGFRQALFRRGGESAARCYQCATCSSVCDLAPLDAPFPRRQMLWAQWGLADRIAADPAVWLCHQCNDCTVRCPRDARPGDVLQTVRGLVVESLAYPRALGRLVAGARTSWPVLLLVPLLFWVVLLGGSGLLRVPADFHAYEQIVPHELLYAVFFPLTGFVLWATWVSGRRFWAAIGASSPRSRPFLTGVSRVLVEIGTHERFGRCDTASHRRLGHLALFWGFAGAALTSGLLIVGIYIQGYSLPLPLDHPYKILGNLSAVLLVVGAGVLVAARVADRRRAGVSMAFDSFLTAVVVLVIGTGVLVEVARLLVAPGLVPAEAAVGLYVLHLGVVTTLFATFPYSKFAHVLYRTLAMVHERASTPSTPAPD